MSTARAAEAIVSHRSPLDASELTSPRLGSSAFAREATHFEVLFPWCLRAVCAVCPCAPPYAMESRVPSNRVCCSNRARSLNRAVRIACELE